MTDQKALEYLNTFQNLQRADLQSKYPGSPSEAIDFLEQILVFNPYFRISLEQCIEHPLFKGVRKTGQVESIKGHPVVLEFEKEELTKERMRELMLYEISHYGAN